MESMVVKGLRDERRISNVANRGPKKEKRRGQAVVVPRKHIVFDTEVALAAGQRELRFFSVPQGGLNTNSRIKEDADTSLTSLLVIIG